MKRALAVVLFGPALIVRGLVRGVLGPVAYHLGQALRGGLR